MPFTRTTRNRWIRNALAIPARNYSRAYLRHLYLAKELLSYRLNTWHNLYYFMELMRELRQAVAEDRFLEFRSNFL